MKCFEQREYQTGTGSIPYRLLLPDPIQPGREYPLVLFLHGIGERGNGNDRQTANAVWQFALPENRKNYPCFVVVPQCPETAKWVEVEWRESFRQAPEPAAPLAATLDIVSDVEKEFPVDSKGISAVGISMGGFGVWDLITRNPDIFSAAVPICGGGDPASAAVLGKMPIWVFHGVKDEVVPVEHSRRMVEATRQAGGAPRYTEYPETGHNAWDPAFEEPGFFPWLLKQRLAR